MATAVQQAGTQPQKGGTAPPTAPAVTGATQGAPGSNRQAFVDAWVDASRTFGEQEGAGSVSKLAWYQDIVQRAYRDELSPDDAPKGVASYTEAKRKRAAMLGKRVSEGAKAIGVRESEARKMIRLGGLAQFRAKDNGGLGVFNKALKIIGDDPDLKGEATKMILKVATEQLRNPDEPMDDDHIRQTLRPKQEADKGEGEYLYSANKQIELAAKASSWDAHKRAASTSIKARLEQIGFKTAQDRRLEEMAKKKLAKEKAEAKAKEAAKKLAAKAAKK